MSIADKAEALNFSLFDEEGKKKSQATLLIELAGKFELFHDPDGNAYAVDNGKIRIVYAVRSKEFRNRLSGDFFAVTGKGCNGNAISDALSTIEAQAVNRGDTRPVYLRIGRVDQCIYIDMGDDLRRAIKVSEHGWEVLDRSPIDFIRRSGMSQLPEPIQGGSINRLRDFLNIDHHDFPLIVGWILGAFRGQCEYPILVLQGEEGTGKSTTARILRGLTDPSTSPLRCPPKTTDDLLVSATGSHVVSLDNLSGITPEIADALCRLSTGGGLDKRRLFTDNDQVLIDLVRPIIVNGIDEIATRSDLSSRSIIIRLPVIKDPIESEERFRSDLALALPSIFGAVLTGISASLTRGYFKIDQKVRMNDFVRWVSLAEPAMGMPKGGFLERFTYMRDQAMKEGIEASPVASALVEYMESIYPIQDWSPTPTFLLETLTRVAGLRAKSKSWPQSARGLLNTMRRLAPQLRSVGITFSKDENHDRLYRFHREEKKAPQAPETPQAMNDGVYRVGA